MEYDIRGQLPAVFSLAGHGEAPSSREAPSESDRILTWVSSQREDLFMQPTRSDAGESRCDPSAELASGRDTGGFVYQGLSREPPPPPVLLRVGAFGRLKKLNGLGDVAIPEVPATSNGGGECPSHTPAQIAVTPRCLAGERGPDSLATLERRWPKKRFSPCAAAGAGQPGDPAIGGEAQIGPSKR